MKTTLREAIKHKSFCSLQEAKALEPSKDGRKRWKVIILTEGKGNPRDKHYYSKNCITDPATSAAFEGKPCFLDHPDAIEEQARPERSVKDEAGWFSKVHAESNSLVATLTQTLTPAGRILEALISDCLAFAQEHPGQNLAGISINASGQTKNVEMDGQTWKQVDSIVEAFSADAVTLPARGGQFLNQEALRKTREAVATADALEIAQAIRTKAESGEVDAKEMRRMIDNLITALNGNSPKKEGEKMKIKGTKLTEALAVQLAEELGISLKEARKRVSNTQAMAKSLAAFHKGMANQTEDEAQKAMFSAEAAKYDAMCGEDEDEDEAEGEDTGAVLAKKKKQAEGENGDNDGDEAEGEDEDESEGEDEDESEASKKDEDEDESEDEDEAEASKKESKVMAKAKASESLKLENQSLKAKLSRMELDKKLAESGLPEVMWPTTRLMVRGLSGKEQDKVIESRLNELEAMNLTESVGNYRRSGASSDEGTSVKSIFAKHQV